MWDLILMDRVLGHSKGYHHIYKNHHIQENRMWQVLPKPYMHTARPTSLDEVRVSKCKPNPDPDGLSGVKGALKREWELYFYSKTLAFWRKTWGHSIHPQCHVVGSVINIYSKQLHTAAIATLPWFLHRSKMLQIISYRERDMWRSAEMSKRCIKSSESLGMQSKERSLIKTGQK